MDLIERQAAIDAMKDTFKGTMVGTRVAVDAINRLPSAEPVIHCEDCKWWDQKFDDSPMGYCMAAKHNHYSTHWEIHIQRTYGKNFFCADAEPKEEGEEDD